MRVLIVSENTIERKQIRNYMETLPFNEYDKTHEIEFIEDKSGNSALGRVTSDYQNRLFFDLIIAAQKMKDLTGMQLAKKLSDEKMIPMPPIAVFCDDVAEALKKERVKEGITVLFDFVFSIEKFKQLMTKIAAILISRVERVRKEKIEDLMEKRNSADFLASLENIYMDSAREISQYKMYATWSSLPYISLGRIYIGCNKYAEAIPNLKTAIDINFNNKKAHRNLVLCYKKTGQSFEELKELYEMLAVVPRSSAVLQKLGDACLREGDYESAAEYLKQAIACHNPTDSKRMMASTHVFLGKAYMAEGDEKEDSSKHEMAKDEFNEAISIDPTLLAAYNSLIVVYKKLDMYEEAQETMAEAIKIMPEDPEGWLSLYEIYLIDGEAQKAKYSLQKALKYEPENQKMLCNAGEIFMRQEMLTEAVELFEKAIEINPSDIRLYNYAGICYRRLNRYERAISNYRKALRIDPKDHNIHYNFGKAWQEAKDYKSARRSYETALSLKPDFPEAKKALEMLEEYRGFKDKRKSVR